jgi:heme/copper-type cytochrome/quinol oxidase subunit 3
MLFKMHLDQSPIYYPSFFRTKEKHYFHLVDNSQLPIITATASMLLVLNIVFYLHLAGIVPLHFFDNMGFQIAWFIFSTILFAWFLTVVSESSQGYHTLAVRQGLRFGMILFIVSEIMFFFAFFWAFFHVSLSPSIAIGGIWPPKSIQSLDVWGLPLVNTILLLSSGVTITLAHHAMLQPINFTSTSNFDKYLLATIILGVTFLYCQGIEYKYGITFRWKENIYGSTFFVTTGFHGLHVTIGTIFLLFCLLRNLITSSGAWGNSLFLGLLRHFVVINSVPATAMNSDQSKIVTDATSKYGMTKDQHLGFEAAAWYWHFVDVVWIFLFITIYWWGS